MELSSKRTPERPPDSIIKFYQRMGSEEIQQLSDWAQYLERENTALKESVEKLQDLCENLVQVNRGE